MPVITNTTLLSNFAGIGCLHLLSRCWKSLYLPEQVYAEIQVARLQGYGFYEGIEQQLYPFHANGWLQLTTLQGTEEVQRYGSLLGNLHHGEAAGLAIASLRKWLFLTDDRAAR